ncbi:MAG: hypothetical protein BGO69_08670 [Bacteroidetes bacterium 46-16]|jgi:hypothetical protein|nr:MAG: hypothetical protein BGO69_08670 [Bacteroidetes bacterium 46-16]
MGLLKSIYILVLCSLGILSPRPVFASASNQEKIGAFFPEGTERPLPFAFLGNNNVHDLLLAPQNDLGNPFAKTSNGPERHNDICYDLAYFYSYRCLRLLTELNRRSAETYFTAIHLKDLFPKHWFW